MLVYYVLDYAQMARRNAVLLLLAGFLALTWMATSLEVRALDVWILQTIFRTRSAALSAMFSVLTALGTVPGAFLSGLAVLRIVRMPGRAPALQLAVATFGGWVLTQIFKRAIGRPRPAIVTHLVSASGFSYPSGHALVAAATYTTLSILICRTLHHTASRRTFSALAFALTLGVAFSRIYLGVHYPSDTVGGCLLGTAWAFAIDNQRFWSKTLRLR